MNIQTKLAHKSNYGGSRPTSQIKYIVIHYTANDGDKAWNNANYFQSANRHASAHYFVDDNYVYQSVPDNYVAWSVGGRKYSDCAKTGGGKLYGKCTNANSISIELCDTNKNGTVYPTNATIKLALELTRFLMSKYNIPNDRVIRHFDVNGKHCLPTDTTELLTPDGWINIKQLNIGDKVLQYNTDGSVNFAPISNVVEPYVTTVYKNRYLEATNDHRMYLKSNSPNSHDFKEYLWGDILKGKKQYIIKTNGNIHGKGINLTDEELLFLVWVQGDGHYMKNKQGDVIGLEFHIKKQRKINRILLLLDELNIVPKIAKQTDKTTKIRIYDESLVGWCEKYLSNKCFTYDFVNMNDHQFDLFWNEVLLCDGCISANSYCSAKKINLDVMQAILVTHGCRSNICQTGINKSIIKTNANYCVGIGCRNVEDAVSLRDTEVSCVTVPSGWIIIRQNGKTFVVGNCPAYWMDNSKWEKEFHGKLVMSVPVQPTYKGYQGGFPIVPPTLKKGSTGLQVQRLQKFLNWYFDNKVVKDTKSGKYVALGVDGIFGQKTYNAVLSFQKKVFYNDVREWDGMFGRKSLEKAKAVKK